MLSFRRLSILCLLRVWIPGLVMPSLCCVAFSRLPSWPSLRRSQSSDNEQVVGSSRALPFSLPLHLGSHYRPSLPPAWLAQASPIGGARLPARGC